MSLRSVPVYELARDELSLFGCDTTADGLVFGYGYVREDLPPPTPAQHAALIARSRALGRFLGEEEVASVLSAEGGDDGHH